MARLSPGSLLAVENSLSPLPENVLTAPTFCRTLKSPNTKRPCRSLCQRPRAGVNFDALCHIAPDRRDPYWRSNVQSP